MICETMMKHCLSFVQQISYFETVYSIKICSICIAYFQMISNLFFRKLGLLIEEMVKTKEGKNTLNNYLVWQVLCQEAFMFLTKTYSCADHQEL